MKVNLLLIGVVFFYINLANATSTVEEVIDELVQDQRQGKVKSVTAKILFDPQNATLAINYFSKYTKDTLPNIRYFAFEYISSIGQKSNVESVRRQSIQSLLDGTKDGYVPVVTLAWERILEFRSDDFSGGPTDYLKNYNAATTLKPELWAKAIGLLRLKSKEGELLSLLNLELSKKAKWQIHLSLSRLNNKQSTAYVLSRIKNIPISDEWISSLLPDLVYTCSKPIFNFLFEIIQSNDKSCVSQNPDAETNIPCGYRVIEAIAPTIKSFPAKIDASGDLIGNYAAVLKETREWIVKIKDGYAFEN